MITSETRLFIIYVDTEGPSKLWNLVHIARKVKTLNMLIHRHLLQFIAQELSELMMLMITMV